MIDRRAITDPAAAALLSSMRQRHIVLALVEEERSQGALAALLGIPLNLLRYHLDRLVAADLVAVVRSEPRRGRAIRHYRATARSFFVPAELAAAVPSRPLMEELYQALEQARAGTYSGILYSWQDGPRMEVQRNAHAGRPAADLWHRMTLTEADARALIAEMKQLFARFEARDNGHGDSYVMLGAIAPS